MKDNNGEPTFCAKDVCEALGIANHRNKTNRLDEDEKLKITQWTAGQRRGMLFVTEPGVYKIILTCRDATNPGTPAHAFCRWVTHEVLPSIRRDKEYKLRESIAIENTEEKGRRLWIVVRDLNVFNYNARRKYFSAVCRATEEFCYVDEFNSPHVHADRLQACRQCIRETMSQAIVNGVPENQRLITDMW